MEREEFDMKEFKEEELCREEYERSCMFEEEDRIARQAFLDEYQRKLERKRKREEQIEKYRIWHRNKMATIQKNKENKAMQLKHSKEDAVPDDDVKVDEYTMLQQFAEELPEETAVLESLEVPEAEVEDEQLQRGLESFLGEEPTSPAESVKVDLVEVKQQPETSPEDGEGEEKEEKEEKSEKDEEKNERDRRKRKKNAAKARSSRMASSTSSRRSLRRTRSRSRTRKSRREYDEMKRRYEKMKREEEMRRMKEEMKRIEKDRKKRDSPTRSRSRRRRQ